MHGHHCSLTGSNHEYIRGGRGGFNVFYLILKAYLKGPSLTNDLRSSGNELHALAATYDVEFNRCQVVLAGGKTNLFIPLRFF